jgi:hypothetical protein
MLAVFLRYSIKEMVSSFEYLFVKSDALKYNSKGASLVGFFFE